MRRAKQLDVLVINAQLVTCAPVMKCCVIYTTTSSCVIIMYGRFHGEDDIFIQANHDIISVRTIGKPERVFIDLFVDVVDAHVQSPQFHKGTLYQHNEPNPKLRFFMTYLIRRKNPCKGGGG